MFPGDATVNPRGHLRDRHGGLRPRAHGIVEGIHVTGFRLADGRVTGGRTDKGLVDAMVAVTLAGLWSRDVGPHGRTHSRLQAVQHAWVQTTAVAGATRDLPIVRDLDGHFYARTTAAACDRRLCAGRKARRTSYSAPTSPSPSSSPTGSTWTRPLAAARCRIPALRDAGLEHFLNAPESFTPDAVFLMGETAEVRDCGWPPAHAQGIIFGPGVGRSWPHG